MVEKVKSALNRLERWSDWLNPLLIREIRQSLRSRVFAGGIILTSVFCVITIICGILWSSASSYNPNRSAGMQIFFFIYFFIWGLACILLPVIAANRFRSERSTGEFELFMITGISARKIILGKLQSCLVQAFLILSIAAPFMMVCYLLRGISALDIFINIVMLFLFSVVLTQAGILIGSFASSKPLFIFLNLPFIFGLLMSFSLVAARIKGDFLQMFGSSTAIIAIFLMLLIMVYVFLLLLLSSISLLELPAKNRTLGLRLALLAGTLILPPLLSFMPRISDRLLPFYLCLGIPAAIAAIFVPVPYRPAPRLVMIFWGRKFARILRPILYPGRGSILTWYGLMMIIICAWECYFFSYDSEAKCFISILCGGLLCWALLANFFIRWWLPKAPTPLLSLMGCAFPSIMALFFLFGDENEIALMLCPVSLPWGIEEADLWPIAVWLTAAFWVGIIGYGIISNIQQTLREKRIFPPRKKNER